MFETGFCFPLRFYPPDVRHCDVLAAGGGRVQRRWVRAGRRQPLEFHKDVGPSHGFSLRTKQRLIQLLAGSALQVSKYNDYDYNFPTKSWALDRIDQVELPLDGYYDPPEEARGGKGVHVYIVDTGVRKTHQEFQDRIGEGVDFIELDFDPNDCNGHGTHCAGVHHPSPPIPGLYFFKRSSVVWLALHVLHGC